MVVIVYCLHGRHQPLLRQGVLLLRRLLRLLCGGGLGLSAVVAVVLAPHLVPDAGEDHRHTPGGAKSKREGRNKMEFGGS